MFRFYAYYSKTNDPTNAIAIRSQKFDDRGDCQTTLDDILDTPGFTGGGIEQHVPGIGWTIADEDEIESMMILARRREESIHG